MQLSYTGNNRQTENKVFCIEVLIKQARGTAREQEGF